MNVGGPALHVSLLNDRLDPRRFESRLLTGSVGSGEASLEHLAEQSAGQNRQLSSLGPEISPGRDLKALWTLWAEIRRFRPHIVHTHAAKAGALGRLAARAAGGPRPILVHTYHGHVLRGYFGPAKTALYRSIERALARHTDCLVGVSQATVDELVGFRIAPRERFTVVTLGLDLSRFTAVQASDGTALRHELGLTEQDILATFVGRLVPIKRVDVLLEAVALARRRLPALRLAVVGDGELREVLEARSAELALGAAVHFVGYRHDVASIVAATDIAVLSSDNEGTPVALIEAAAAGRPAIATAVGGVGDIVGATTGRLVAAGDADGFAEALVELGMSPILRQRLGEAARNHVAARYTAERLVADVEHLYDRLLARADVR